MISNNPTTFRILTVLFAWICMVQGVNATTIQTDSLQLDHYGFFAYSDFGAIRDIYNPSPTEYLHFQYTYYEEVDLGWYQFVGGTGEFTAYYQSGVDKDSYNAGVVDSNFPCCGDPMFGEIYRTETFNTPFRIWAAFFIQIDVFCLPEDFCRYGFDTNQFTMGSRFTAALTSVNDWTVIDGVDIVPITPMPELSTWLAVGFSIVLMLCHKLFLRYN